jgi:hypothetical protein
MKLLDQLPDICVSFAAQAKFSSPSLNCMSTRTYVIIFGIAVDRNDRFNVIMPQHFMSKGNDPIFPRKTSI